MSERLTLTAADEYFCHQTVQTFDEVASTDRNWTEKSYIVAFDDSGSVMITIGVGKYTNRNVMDAFAGVAVSGRQYNVRASRELRPDWDTTTVGPIEWHIVQPPKANRVVLGPNDTGISYDISFISDYLPIVGVPGRRRINGITDNHTIRYFQPGRAHGHVTVEGKTYTLSEEKSFAYKDRSWGIRTMSGVPRENSFHFREESAAPETGLAPVASHVVGILHGYLNISFENFAISCLFTQDANGKSIPSATGAGEGFVIFPDGSGKAPIKVVSADLDFEFWPGTRRGKSMSGLFTLEDGSTRSVVCKWKNLIWNFRGGGYFGFRGWWQGKYMGAYAIASESLDLNDKAVRDELYGCEEIAVDCECEGQRGLGVLEPWAIGELPRYKIKAEDLG